MTKLEKIPTQIPGLDQLLEGGLPKGRATLISGRSGACKTVVSLELATNFAKQGIPTVFVAIEESPEDLLDTADSLSMQTRELHDEEKLAIVDLMHPLSGQLFIRGDFDITGLVTRLSHIVESVGAKALVLDSISSLFSPVPSSPGLRHHFFYLVRKLSEAGLTVVLTTEAAEDYGQIGSLGLEDHVCDAVIVLRNVVEGKRRRRTVEVHKYRRSSHLKGEYPIALTERGLAVFPLDAALPRQREVGDMERYSSGVDGLDDMTGGGWLRDSITLVRGPTGSGKTLLAGTFATAGAARGERVFYYGFEETGGMLVRNFEALGLPFRKYIDSGNLKVTARFPEATSPEDMIIELRAVLDQYEPSLIVLDSISAIEHVISYGVFRQFMIGITSALRQFGRSALLTQATADREKHDDAAPYLSTLADAIVQLNYEYDNEEQRQRSVRIIKMRGSAHDLGNRQLAISESGVSVEPTGGPRS